MISVAQPGESACAVHPDRASYATCQRCGAFACAQCLREGEGGQTWCADCFSRVPQGLTPWDRREELGFFKAWFQTAWATVSRPKSFFETAESDGSIGSSFVFALVSSFCGYLPTFAVYGLVFGGMAAFDGDKLFKGDKNVGPIMVAVFAGYALLLPLFYAAWSFVQGGIDHLVLKVAGEKRPFSVTYRGTALSMGPLMFGIIPICSLYALPWWVLIVRMFGYAGLHRTSLGKGALGAFVSTAVCCIGFVTMYAAFFAIAMASRRP